MFCFLFSSLRLLRFLAAPTELCRMMVINYALNILWIHTHSGWNRLIFTCSFWIGWCQWCFVSWSVRRSVVYFYGGSQIHTHIPTLTHRHAQNKQTCSLNFIFPLFSISVVFFFVLLLWWTRYERNSKYRFRSFNRLQVCQMFTFW